VSSTMTQVSGYLLLAIAAAAMAIGAAGIFRPRLRAVVIYSGAVQCGYAALGLSAGMLTGEHAAYVATVFQVIAAGVGVSLMWIAARAVSAEWGENWPPAGGAPPAWAVFCLTLACMSLVGLPPLAGLPAKVAVIQAGLREPGVLFVVTLGAAALGVVSLWVYSGIVLPLITGRISPAPVAVSVRMRVGVDILVAALLGLGLVPYIGFAIGAALTGGR
jgi:multicomponent Na+:H+ antiporter subunit D